jgi:hypothetical protein
MWKNEAYKLLSSISGIRNAKSVFFFFFLQKIFLCLALYWSNDEFSDVTLHLVCFCILYLLLRNSITQFVTTKGISSRISY